MISNLEKRKIALITICVSKKTKHSLEGQKTSLVNVLE
jgi:hypothetical protein